MSSMLHILGASLAEMVGKEEFVCRGMLRLAIEDIVEHLHQTTDHRIWKEHLKTMNFRDW